MAESKRIVTNYEIPMRFGGTTDENMERWRAEARDILNAQPWLDDDTAMMEAKKKLFGE